jgi:hypothetical protein
MVDYKLHKFYASDYRPIQDYYSNLPKSDQVRFQARGFRKEPDWPTGYLIVLVLDGIAAADKFRAWLSNNKDRIGRYEEYKIGV